VTAELMFGNQTAATSPSNVEVGGRSHEPRRSPGATPPKAAIGAASVIKLAAGHYLFCVLCYGGGTQKNK